MRIQEHGGACCGMRHVSGFVSNDDHLTLRMLKDILRGKKTDDGRVVALHTDYTFRELEDNTGLKHGKIIEAVLTDLQIRRLPITCAYMKQYGFKLVHRFKNSTGTFCNVLHYCYSTLPSEESPWEQVDDTCPVTDDNGNLTPQVGQVWRVNVVGTSRLRKNCYVQVIELNAGSRWSIRVMPLNPVLSSQVSCAGPSGVYQGCQYVNAHQISFVRETV